MSRLVLLLLTILPMTESLALTPPCPTVQWTETQRVSFPGVAGDLAPFDFDEDGALDVVARIDTTLTWWKGGGDGTLGAAAAVSPLPVHAVTLGDVNGDGADDVLALAVSGSDPVLLIANGGGTAHATFVQHAFVTAEGLALVQLDADLERELAAWNEDELAIRFFDLTDGGYVELLSSKLYLLAPPRRVVVLDLDADGDDDFLVNTTSQSVAYFTGEVAPFTNREYIPVDSKDFVVADMDGDGDPDVAGLDASRRRIVSYNEGGSFSWSVIPDDPRFFGMTPSFVTVADANGDALNDLIVFSAYDRTVQTFSGLGARQFRYATFGLLAPASSASQPMASVAGDLDGNGEVELIVAMTDALLVMAASCEAQVQLAGSGYPVAAGERVAVSAIVRGFAPSAASAPGTIAIRDADGMLLGEGPIDATGRAVIELAPFEVGTETLTAQFSGNEEHPAGISPPVVFVVAEPVELKIVVPAEPSYYGKAWPVTVESPCCNLMLTILVDGVETHTTYGTDPVHLQLEPGPHTLVARFGGSPTQPPAESPAVDIVTRKALTTLTVDSATIAVRAGEAQSIVFNLRRKDGQTGLSGNVTLREGTTDLETVAAASFITFRRTFATGTHHLHAVYAGDKRHEAAVSETVILDVFPPTGFHLAAHALRSEVRLSAVVPFDWTNHRVYRRIAGSTAWSQIVCPRLYVCYDPSAQRGVLYEYRAEALDGSNVSYFSNTDSVLLFTDDPLVASETPVKAIHFAELRTAVNELRKKSGLQPFDFGGSMAPGRPIAAAHVDLLRTKLSEALIALGAPIALAPRSAVVRAVDLHELRDLTR